MITDTNGIVMSEPARLTVLLRPEVVVPVPLHPNRLRWRGYNQCLELARQALTMFHWPG